MKRLLLGLLACSLVMGAYALSSNGQAKKDFNSEIQVEVKDKNPWTTLRVNDQPNSFHFAVVSDRTGGHRARIFAEAVDKLNLMQPAFVVSVGDLIEGYTKEQPKLTAEWKEFQGYVDRLQMPFFYVAGNHDISNPLQSKDWQDRFGRAYYHFVYRNVLFLILLADDPSVEKGAGKISPEQVKYMQKALSDNPRVSWTMVFLHRPLWTSTKLEATGWLDVEKALLDRNYTVFVGHEHVYQKFIRNGGKSYYQLATTGGGSKVRGVPYGEFDHFVWVTMKKEGPVLANVLLSGVLPENFDPTVRDEKGVSQKDRPAVYAARAKVLFKGQPVPNAVVALYTIPDDARKKTRRVADGMVDNDGVCLFSTFDAFDGAPEGKYSVTVRWNVPHIDETTGKPGPNKLPERYALPATSGLQAEIRAGQPNMLILNLMP